MSLTGPQRALISTISHGQESIHRAESMLTEKAQLPPLGNDPASVRWKETQKNTSKQSVHSQVSAMNAATAQMVRFLLNQYLKNLKKYYVRLFYCFRLLCQFVLSIVGDVDRAR